MLQQKDFLADLRRIFRLNIYEVRIWTALLSRGIASAGELADISGVPRSRCYDVLESLEKKGFIIMKIGKPIKYLAVKPEIILERVKSNIKQEADELASQIENVRETDEFRELEILHKTGVQHIDITSMSKSIVGSANINKLIKEMAARAKSSIVVVTNQENLERHVKRIKPPMPSLGKMGIKAKLFAPYNKNVAKKLLNVDYIQYTPTTRFASIDGSEMVFMISNENVAAEYEVAIWIQSPFFVNAVNVLFEESLK